MGVPTIYFEPQKKKLSQKIVIFTVVKIQDYLFGVNLQSIFKPFLSDTDEVNRCERFPLTPCARTFHNKESIHYNTMNCRAKTGGPVSGSAWYF